MSQLTVIVPTRSRPYRVPDIVRAWWETGAFGAARLLFVVDQDDMHISEYKAELDGVPEAGYVAAPRWQPMVPKLDEVAVQQARVSPFVAFMGDDHLPRTPGWVSRLVAAHASNKAAIVYGRDGLRDRDLPTWWSMDSRVVHRLGRMVPASVQHLYCDNAVKELGKRIDSLVYLDDVLVEHMHPIAGKAAMDDQYVRVNRRQQYDRDRDAFRTWMATGLQRDATLLADLWG